MRFYPAARRWTVSGLILLAGSSTLFCLLAFVSVASRAEVGAVAVLALVIAVFPFPLNKFSKRLKLSSTQD
jgi:hypothetical protein